VVTDLNAKSSARFEEFWEKYPRRQHKSAAAMQFVSLVTIESEAAVFACLDRYLASDEVARGVLTNPETWLSKQYQDGWTGEWPAAKHEGEYEEDPLDEPEQANNGALPGWYEFWTEYPSSRFDEGPSRRAFEAGKDETAAILAGLSAAVK
jgi:hypothetical protein